MKINQVLPEIGVTKSNSTSTKATTDFAQMLNTAIYNVNSSLQHADEAAILLAQGDMEIHDAMIITEKANLALQLTMAIRNKVIEAYQEIMRMQV